MFRMYFVGQKVCGVALPNVVGVPISRNETMCSEIERMLQAVSFAADLYGTKRLCECLKCALQAKQCAE